MMIKVTDSVVLLTTALVFLQEILESVDFEADSAEQINDFIKMAEDHLNGKDLGLVGKCEDE